MSYVCSLSGICFGSMFLEACSILTIKHQDKSAGIVFEYFMQALRFSLKTLWHPMEVMFQNACEVVIF